ncbi:MAG: sigma-70 family RNA polymerase sigma factor [Verrucomicrobiales bacterium]|nr:sigma-70 family RNA polymerase sigma factor [Verrucomicrobiales bacterium]
MAVSPHAESTGVPEDAELFARLRDGDAAAFAQFYDRHAPLLYGVALKILGNEQDAEDVLQDAAVQIWERAPQYRLELGHPLSWSVALTRNKAIDRLRSVRRRTEVHESAAAEPVAAPAPEASSPLRAMAAETGDTIRRGLQMLSMEQREAIELAFLGGLTQQEIAIRLGQPLGTIKARIRRGMLALKDMLEGQL